jgi:hypothetical protein
MCPFALTARHPSRANAAADPTSGLALAPIGDGPQSNRARPDVSRVYIAATVRGAIVYDGQARPNRPPLIELHCKPAACPRWPPPPLPRGVYLPH